MNLTITPSKFKVYSVALWEAVKDRFHPKRRWGFYDYSFTYKGYFVYWTGWKLAQGRLKVVGQWAAVPECGRAVAGFYASLPGGEGRFVVNDEKFDTDYKPGQEAFYITDKRKAAFLGVMPFVYIRRQECWLRLKALIEANPLKISAPASDYKRRKALFMAEIRKNA